MPRIKLTIEYDGTDYVGWQVQPNGPSIQSTLEQALTKLLGEPISIQASGRTDSGVHARGQVAAFSTERVLPLKAYERGLNGLLPYDIAVRQAEEVEAAFDPRRWSRGKVYVYSISNQPVRSPLLRRTHWEVFAPLDVEAMQQGARCLIGRHDFSAFRAANCQAAHALRELRRVEVAASADRQIAITLEGTAFLKHMVRNIVGTLVEVGRGKRPPEWVGRVLEGRDRTCAGATAPPQGLCLEQVFHGSAPAEQAPDDGAEE